MRLLPHMGATVWALAFWVSFFSRLSALLISLVTTMVHLAFLVSEHMWSCPSCSMLFVLEGIASAWASLQWGLVHRLRQEGRMAVMTMGIAGGSFATGLILIPVAFAYGCPDEYRRWPPPPSPRSGRHVMLFLHPSCPVCANLSSNVLPEFKDRLAIHFASPCNRHGRSLIRSYAISSYPTLLVTMEGRIVQRECSFGGIIRSMAILCGKPHPQPPP